MPVRRLKALNYEDEFATRGGGDSRVKLFSTDEMMERMLLKKRGQNPGLGEEEDAAGVEETRRRREYQQHLLMLRDGSADDESDVQKDDMEDWLQSLHIKTKNIIDNLLRNRRVIKVTTPSQVAKKREQCITQKLRLVNSQEFKNVRVKRGITRNRIRRESTVKKLKQPITASHAGSWYTDSAKELGNQLQDWLIQGKGSQGPARAIIAPHAGYRYCGQCAGSAYKQINPNIVKRVFILGPSHHVRLSGCALSSVKKYQTPLYDLTIDIPVYKELQNTGYFEFMNLETDEDEHSIEMHLPYVAKVFESNRNFTIVPILVGSLSLEREMLYGRVLAQYLADPSNLFIISSDFCHWGQRFRYTFYEKSYGDIYQSIQKLDQQGMSLIEMLDTAGFADYLKKYGNTICGRHPIGVLLNMIDSVRQDPNFHGRKMSLKFVDYAQSSQCRSFNDSSVSYASASLVID
uniref:EOG090X09ZA n=1 Tax=Moina brachiata TaxID=675436 RepID=A0A4Y7NIT7_9CRUS|nr:EOG090X09ZA [Moina brachiata]SVE93140.1 EOG090X09ZA [Moina brachiata]